MILMSDLNMLKDDTFLASHMAELGKIMIGEALDIVIYNSTDCVKYKVGTNPENPSFSNISKGIVVGQMSVLELLSQYDNTELKNTVFALPEHNHIESVDDKLKEFSQRGAKVFIVKSNGKVVPLSTLSATSDNITCTVEPPVKSKVVYTFDVQKEGFTMVAINVKGDVSKLWNPYDNTSVRDFINRIKKRDLVKYGAVLDNYIIAVDESGVLDSDTHDELRKLTKNSPSQDVVCFDSRRKDLELIIEYYVEGSDDHITSDTDDTITIYPEEYKKHPVKSKTYTFDVQSEGIKMVAINVEGEVYKLLNHHDNTSVREFINQVKTRDLVKYGVVLDRYIIAMNESCVLDSWTLDELNKLTKNSPSQDMIYFNSSLNKLELTVEYHMKGFDDYIKSNTDCIHFSPLVSEQDIMKRKKATYHDYSIDLYNPEVRMIMIGATGQVYMLVNPLTSITNFINNVVMCESIRENNTDKDFIIVTRLGHMNNLDVEKAIDLHTSKGPLSPIVITDVAEMVTFRTDRTLDYTIITPEELQDVFIYLTSGTPRDGGSHENVKNLLFQVLSTMNNMNQHVGILTETGNLYTTKSQDMCYTRPFYDMNMNEEGKPRFVVLANEDAFSRKNIDFFSAISLFTEANIRFFKSAITSPNVPMLV